VIALWAAIVGAIGVGFGIFVERYVVRRAVARRIASLAGIDASLADELAQLERVVPQLQREVVVQREALATARHAIDALHVGLVVVDAHGRHVLANRVAATMGGARHTDALVAEAITTLAASARGGSPQSRLLEFVGPPRRTIMVKAEAFEFPTDGQMGAIVVVEDVTERQHLEDVRTDFVANVSHELKTPVGALALLAETMAEEGDPQVVQRLAGKMVREAHRVGRIIGDLLDLSRIETGGSASGSVQLRRVINESIERVRGAAADRSIKVERTDLASKDEVRGDRRQLVSALGNLLENAVKYSDPGSTIELRVLTELDAVVFEVEDHGMGIPARDLDRIFERFYRVDRARSRETGGTGLGLSIVRHVAHNHGGTVTVRSIEGEGSIFVLRIPNAQPPTEMAEAG
jgi:two-component system sensor histidine kinase SenX3